MIQLTITYSINLTQDVLQDLEHSLKNKLQSKFPLHAIFIFFFKSELETNILSTKIEIVSKKGVSDEEGKFIVDEVEKEVLSFRNKNNFENIPIAIWLSPNLGLENVRWINPV